MRTRFLALATWMALALASVIVGCQHTIDRPAQPTSAPPASLTPPDLICGGASGRACQLSMLATEPDDGAIPLLNAFNSATASIDYVPFELDDKRIVGSLAQARQRGVRVRVLLEPAPGGDVGSSYAALVTLSKAGVETRDSNPAFALTHAKYAIIDSAQTLIFTFNSTASDLASKRDFAVADNDVADARFAQSLFNADWDRGLVEPTPPGFVVSPENSNVALARLVDSANRELDLYAEKLLPSPLLDAILAAARRGVSVRILAAPLSETRDRARERLLEVIRSGQLQLRIPRSPRVHAKILVVDRSVVFIGSQNVQDASRERRRELGITFDDAAIAGTIRATFERDWNAKFDSLE